MIEQVTQMTGFKNPNQKGRSEFNTETFIRLLTVQLSTQNPLDPMKDAEMFAQIAQLGQVDGLGKLQTSVDMQQASSYLGKTVVAVRPDTAENYKVDILEGKVTKVLVRDGDPYLVVQEANGGSVEIQLSHVQQVKN